jgi:simple sugar transport system permease protein
VKGWVKQIVSPVVASLISFTIGGILAASLGYNPLSVYGALIEGAFGNPINIGNTLAGATPLILTGVGVALGFRAGLFNIGAEGQYWIGATAAVWVGYHFTHMNGFLHATLCLLVAMIAGGLWAGIIPGLTKAFRGAHEVITTMMMSYIGIFFGRYLIENGPMMQPGYVPQSPQISQNAWLTTLIEGSQLTTGIVIALVATVIVWILLFKTTLGFQLRTVGFNQRAAKYAGVRVALFTILSLGLSGVLAGLAGGVQMLAVDHRLLDSFNTGYGFTAIVVALLARSHPLGCIISAIFFAALNNGSQYMQQATGIQSSLTDVLTGLIIFFVAAERLIPMVKDWVRTRKHRWGTTQVSREGHKSA